MALLGAHVSISGGLEKAVERGVELGCEAIQIFTSNQMTWQARPLSDDEAALFRKTVRGVGGGMPVISHDSYLINLGSPEAEKLEKSRKAFAEELERCERLGVNYLVFHPGSHLNMVSESDCLKTIADSLNRVVADLEVKTVQILLENTAGQGSNVGYRFQHLADILAQLDAPERFGVCIDTCHTLAAGYDIRTEEGYAMMMADFDRIVGLGCLKAFHLNDSKKPLGSRVDRHENIGQGCVGLAPFACLVNDPRFEQTPMVLETPGGDMDYRDNLEQLRALIRHSRPKARKISS